MSQNENAQDGHSTSKLATGIGSKPDLLGRTEDVISHEVPPGVDRRTFLMRSAVVGATAVMVGRTVSAQERIARATAAPPQVTTPEVPLAPER